MSTEAKSSPPRGATAVLAPAAPDSALAQIAFAIRAAAAVAAGIAALFIPRAVAGPAADAGAPPGRTAPVAAEPAGPRAS
jgi:hypothetical protein